MPPMTRHLHRSRRHRLIAGVCGGIAQRLGWSPLLVRILFVLGAVLPIFPGAVVYVVLWLVLPKAEA
jgi:phage shock protein C